MDVEEVEKVEEVEPHELAEPATLEEAMVRKKKMYEESMEYIKNFTAAYQDEPTLRSNMHNLLHAIHGMDTHFKAAIKPLEDEVRSRYNSGEFYLDALVSQCTGGTVCPELLAEARLQWQKMEHTELGKFASIYKGHAQRTQIFRDKLQEIKVALKAILEHQRIHVHASVV